MSRPVLHKPEQVTAPAELAGAEDPAPRSGSVGEHINSYFTRVRAGDMGSLPAFGGLVVLVAFFWAVHPSFGSLGNLSDLIKQSSPTICLAMGLVFVLLLGEIDLAAGTAAGVCACVMTRLSVGYEVHWSVAILGALGCGIVIGVLTGILCAKVRIPSFVVTLALFLAFQGVSLMIVNNGPGQTGNVSLADSFLGSIYNGQMDAWAGWVVAAVVVLVYAAVKVSTFVRRQRAGLITDPAAVLLVKVGSLAVASAVVVYLLNQNRALNKAGSIANVNGHLVKVPGQKLLGVPWVVLLIVLLFGGLTFLSPAPGTDVTSTPPAATPRRHGVPASRSTGSGSRSS